METYNIKTSNNLISIGNIYTCNNSILKTSGGIISDGRVGIGTNIPTYELDVNNGTIACSNIIVGGITLTGNLLQRLIALLPPS